MRKSKQTRGGSLSRREQEEQVNELKNSKYRQDEKQQVDKRRNSKYRREEKQQLVGKRRKNLTGGTE